MTSDDVRELEPDPLFHLELRVARRADELAQARPMSTALECWLLAERELVGDMTGEAAGPTTLSASGDQ